MCDCEYVGGENDTYLICIKCGDRVDSVFDSVSAFLNGLKIPNIVDDVLERNILEMAKDFFAKYIRSHIRRADPLKCVKLSCIYIAAIRHGYLFRRDRLAMLNNVKSKQVNDAFKRVICDTSFTIDPFDIMPTDEIIIRTHMTEIMKEFNKPKWGMEIPDVSIECNKIINLLNNYGEAADCHALTRSVTVIYYILNLHGHWDETNSNAEKQFVKTCLTTKNTVITFISKLRDIFAKHIEWGYQ